MALPSLLGMPVEIRVLIYPFLFRDAEAALHDIPQESTHPVQADSSQRASDRACTRTDRKQCVGLLLANRLISKEATEIFLRETTFTIDDCPCWNSGGLLEDSLTKPRQALPNIHHLAVYGAIKAELGYLQYLLTSTSTWYRIAGKNGFPSKLKTLEIKGLVNLCILEHYISLGIALQPRFQ